MKDLVIVGAGGFGRETALLVEQICSWNLLGFYDDNIDAGTNIDGKKVLGNVHALRNLKGELAVVIGIANPLAKQDVFERLQFTKLTFPSIIHPSVLKGSSLNKIGKGSIVTAGVILTTGIFIDDFVVINLATTIGHDACISKFTSIMTQCNISGNVTLGKRCYMGSAATVLPGLKIGDDSVIGAGAVVTKSFSSKAKLIGVPAKNLL